MRTWSLKLGEESLVQQKANTHSDFGELLNDEV